MHLKYLFFNHIEAYTSYLNLKSIRFFGIGMLNYAQDIFISSLLLLTLKLNEPDRPEAETKNAGAAARLAERGAGSLRRQ